MASNQEQGQYISNHGGSLRGWLQRPEARKKSISSSVSSDGAKRHNCSGTLAGSEGGWWNSAPKMRSQWGLRLMRPEFLKPQKCWYFYRDNQPSEWVAVSGEEKKLCRCPGCVNKKTEKNRKHKQPLSSEELSKADKDGSEFSYFLRITYQREIGVDKS